MVMLHGGRWELERIHQELATYMRKAYHAVAEVARKHQVDVRMAAFVLAIGRVVEAATSRRSVTESVGIGR